MAAQNQTQINSTTQDFLEVHDITGNIVVMKDGSTSLIISVNAINFGLLAEEEQDAIIYSYAGLMNSLNYSIQILISSQTKDVSQYLHQLDEQIEQSTDRLRQAQIRQYREFVSALIQERNVLDKKFYVVIPASPLEMGLLPASSVLPGSKGPDISSIERSVILEKARTILEPKRDHLIGQFARIGLYARQLETQEIIQLFYNSYNPEASEGQQITNSRDYTTPLVQADIRGATAAAVGNPLVSNQSLAAEQMAQTMSQPETAVQAAAPDQPLPPIQPEPPEPTPVPDETPPPATAPEPTPVDQAAAQAQTQASPTATQPADDSLAPLPEI